MLGLLISLFDLGILTTGNVKEKANASMNRKEAKAIGKLYYRDGSNYRSTENGHIVTVTNEGVRDTKTGILLEDYEEKRKLEQKKYENNKKEKIEKAAIDYINNPFFDNATWIFYTGNNLYYNKKTEEKACRYGFNKDGRLSTAICELEYNYYIDDTAFYFNGNPSWKSYEISKNNYIKKINDKKEIDILYSYYLEHINHNQKIYNKYKNKDFVEKHNIELIPVDRINFIDKFEKVK